jgi:hypothetical protein
LGVPAGDITTPIFDLFNKTFTHTLQQDGTVAYRIDSIPALSHQSWRQVAFIVPTWLFIPKSHFATFLREHVLEPLAIQRNRGKIINDAVNHHSALISTFTRNAADIDYDSVQGFHISAASVSNARNALLMMATYYNDTFKEKVYTVANRGQHVNIDMSEIPIPPSAQKYIAQHIERNQQNALLKIVGGGRVAGPGGAAASRWQGNRAAKQDRDPRDFRQQQQEQRQQHFDKSKRRHRWRGGRQQQQHRSTWDDNRNNSRNNSGPPTPAPQQH